MLKQRILMVSVVLLVSSLAMTVHSAEVKKINPDEIRDVRKALPTKTQPSTQQIERLKPDLTITDMSITPATPKKGQSAIFTAKVLNKGAASAPWHQAAIRVGGDPNSPPISVHVLAPNASQQISRQVTINQAGKFRVTFIADPSGSVTEINETNNSKYLDFTVKDILPDLTVVNPRVEPAQPTVKDQIRLTATLNNIGDIPAGAFKTGVRIGGESQPKSAGSVGHLDVTTPQSQQYVVSRLWNTTRPGKYVVEFYVDVDDDVKEHNEQNNKISFVITVGP